MATRLGKVAFIFLVFAHSVVVAEASQEHVLQLTTFRLESVNQIDPGNIIVHGSRDQSGNFHELEVEIAGLVVAVPVNILQQIPMNANGVIISSEAGYESLGVGLSTLRFSSHGQMHEKYVKGLSSP